MVEGGGDFFLEGNLRRRRRRRRVEDMAASVKMAGDVLMWVRRSRDW